MPSLKKRRKEGAPTRGKNADKRTDDQHAEGGAIEPRGKAMTVWDDSVGPISGDQTLCGHHGGD